MAYNWLLGKTYSFSVYPSNVLGTDFTNVKVQGIIDPDTASRMGLDIDSKHALVYPSLPPQNGTPDDPRQYNYLRILTSSGTATILGLPWIDETSVVLVTSQKAIATIQGITAQDIPNIKQILAMNNYNNVSIVLAD